MKNLAYAFYVVIVLLISGLARANAATIDSVQYQSPVQIAQISVDAAKAELLIAGSLPNPCFGTPSALMTQDSQDPDVLVLRLSSPTPMNSCISKVKYFSATVALPTLAEASRVKIDSKTVYTLRVEGSEFEMKVSGSDLNR
jgi:hypothetical protein